MNARHPSGQLLTRPTQAFHGDRARDKSQDLATEIVVSKRLRYPSDASLANVGEEPVNRRRAVPGDPPHRVADAHNAIHEPSVKDFLFHGANRIGSGPTYQKLSCGQAPTGMPLPKGFQSLFVLLTVEFKWAELVVRPGRTCTLATPMGLFELGPDDSRFRSVDQAEKRPTADYGAGRSRRQCQTTPSSGSLVSPILRNPDFSRTRVDGLACPSVCASTARIVASSNAR